MEVGDRTLSDSSGTKMKEHNESQKMIPLYAKKWITLVKLEPESIEYDVIFKELLPVLDWPNDNPDLCLDFIQEVLSQTNDERVLYRLAAGPIESVLAHHPYKSIVILEGLSEKLPKLRNIMDGVWQNNMPDDVWQRVQKLTEK